MKGNYLAQLKHFLPSLREGAGIWCYNAEAQVEHASLLTISIFFDNAAKCKRWHRGEATTVASRYWREELTHRNSQQEDDEFASGSSPFDWTGKLVVSRIEVGYQSKWGLREDWLGCRWTPSLWDLVLHRLARCHPRRCANWWHWWMCCAKRCACCCGIVQLHHGWGGSGHVGHVCAHRKGNSGVGWGR